MGLGLYPLKIPVNLSQYRGIVGLFNNKNIANRSKVNKVQSLLNFCHEDIFIFVTVQCLILSQGRCIKNQEAAPCFDFNFLHHFINSICLFFQSSSMT